mmetsp:Transcript_13192/g.32379  ORF Transcript_13192/g.32379 Transcript_13192/m.32379 type:complete len:283 (-) Transcript_13192:740-1588(-)
MDCTPSLVSVQAAHLHGLVHNTLPRYGRITMYKHWQGILAHFISFEVHLGLRFPENQWIHCLEVRWIRQEFQVQLATIRVCPVEGGSEVVLYITRIRPVVRNFIADSFKFFENLLCRLTNHVTEDRETSTVGHSNEHVLNPKLAGPIDQSLHSWDHTLATFKAESFRSPKFCGKKSFEHIGKCQPLQYRMFLFFGVGFVVNFNSITNPVAFLPLSNVHVFKSDFATIYFLTEIDQLLQGCHTVLIYIGIIAQSSDIFDPVSFELQAPVPIFFPEAVGEWIQV